MTVPIPFATQAYQLKQVQFAAQRCINLFPELGPPGAKVPLALIGTPGLTTYADSGNGGPIRGLIKMQEFVFVVSGSQLFRLYVNGDTFFLGELPGTGLVKLASNGDQILILTGTSASDGFIATTTTLEQITDEDFLGGSDCDFIDGYFVISRPETNEFYISALYNGLEYDPLDFARAEGAPDDIIGLVVDHREIWLMCERTTEVWYNSGNEDFPFERASGTFIERGLAARDSIAKIDNTIMWLGNDRIVYRADGYSPRRISQHAIEQKINETIGTGDIVAFGYSQNGHSQYVLKKPNEWTFVYDSATQLWHERISYRRDDYKVSTYVSAFNRLLVGDDKVGKIYYIDDQRPNREDDETVVSRMAAPPLFANEEEAILNALVVDFERGVGQNTDPSMFETQDNLVVLNDGERVAEARASNTNFIEIPSFEIPLEDVSEAVLLIFAGVRSTTGAKTVTSCRYGDQDVPGVGPLVTEISGDQAQITAMYYWENPPIKEGTIEVKWSANCTNLGIHAMVVDKVSLPLAINDITDTFQGSAQDEVIQNISVQAKPSFLVSFGNFRSGREILTYGDHSRVRYSPGTNYSMSTSSNYSVEDGSKTLRWVAEDPPFTRWAGITVRLASKLVSVRDPIVFLRYSDDGGLTWSSEKWRSLGKVGKYRKRARWNRMGRFRQRVLELSIADPVQRTIMGAYARLERGSL